MFNSKHLPRLCHRLPEQKVNQNAGSHLQKLESETLAAIHPSKPSQLDRLRGAAKDCVTLCLITQFETSCPPAMRIEIRQTIDAVTKPVEALLQVHDAFESAKSFLMEWTADYPYRPGTDVDLCLDTLARATSPDVVGLLPDALRRRVTLAKSQMAIDRKEIEKIRLTETVLETLRSLEHHLREAQQRSV